MSKLRHWKQRWDPRAELIFTKRMLLLGKQIERGDPVTPEIRAKLGPHRLKVWWQAGVLSLADWNPKKPREVKLIPEPVKEPEPVQSGKDETKVGKRKAKKLRKDLDGKTK